MNCGCSYNNEECPCMKRRFNTMMPELHFCSICGAAIAINGVPHDHYIKEDNCDEFQYLLFPNNQLPK